MFEDSHYSIKNISSSPEYSVSEELSQPSLLALSTFLTFRYTLPYSFCVKQQQQFWRKSTISLYDWIFGSSI